MPPQLPAAGPSRVANFFSDEEEVAEDPVPLVNGRKKRKLENGSKPKQKRKVKEDGGAKRKREEVAAELLEKRYELPFYQGEY